MRCGYLPNNLTSVGECELYMLPGLAAEFDACRIAGLTISRIDYGEFRLLEKSQFIDDLQDVFVYNRVPFYCIFSSYDIDENIGPARSYLRAQAVLRLARSLWLLKEGTLFNPLHFIQYKRTQGLNERTANVYGRLAYSLSGHYELTRQELPVLEGIFYALACYDEARVSDAFELAEQLFIATYIPALIEPTDKFLLLLGGLEALAGQSVQRLVKATWITTEQRSLLERFRMYRNGVAHGKQSAEPQQLTALREIVRCLLREALVWSLQEPSATQVVGGGLVDRLLNLDDAGPQRLATVEFEYPKFFRG